jgi:hypothetical protein
MNFKRECAILKHVKDNSLMERKSDIKTNIMIESVTFKLFFAKDWCRNTNLTSTAVKYIHM